MLLEQHVRPRAQNLCRSQCASRDSYALYGDKLVDDARCGATIARTRLPEVRIEYASNRMAGSIKISAGRYSSASNPDAG